MVDDGHIVAELDRCRSSVAHWLNTWGWAEDPRLPPGSSRQPIRLFGDQARYLAALSSPYSVVVDKSRDYGVSLLGILHMTHGCLFSGGRQYGVASRTEVDLFDATSSSIIGKAVYALRALPPWMASEVDSARAARRDPLASAAIRFPVRWHLSQSRPLGIAFSTGSAIQARCSAPDAFRGPRFSRAWVDEAAVVPRLGEVISAAVGSGSPLLLSGTPRGRAGFFPRLIHQEGGVSVVPFGQDGEGWRHLRLHYSTDPRKTAEIIRALKSSHTPEAWAQEYEIDYEASVPGRFWPELSAPLHLLSEQEWRALCLRSDLDVYEGWDFGLKTSAVWVAHDRRADTCVVIDACMWDAATHDVVARDIAERRSDFAPNGWATNLNQFGRKPVMRVGDPSGAARLGATAQSWCQYLRVHGIDIVAKHISGRVEELQQRVRVALVNERLRFSPLCRLKRNNLPSLWECCEQYRRRVLASGVVLEEAEKLGDAGIFSHSADALQYALDWVWPQGKVAAWYSSGGKWREAR